MKTQPVDVAYIFDLPSGKRTPLRKTPGGALWAAVHDGVLYYRWEPGTRRTPEDEDRWLALVGGDDWGSSHGPLF